MTDNIFFIKDQIQARITPNKPVNKSGYVYAGREYENLMVEIIILKDEGSDHIAVDKSTTRLCGADLTPL